MRTSLEWLGDYLGGPANVPPLERCAELLTMGGFPVEQWGGEGEQRWMEVEITSNRPDLLCHVGVARELSALARLPFHAAAASPPEAGEPAREAVSVAIERPELCPHYTARVIRGVKIGPSPDWLRRRLEAVGLRSINNVVDVTNYVLFETGQPLHAFDFDKIRGRRIVVRAARDGETLRTLDGVDRKLTADMLVIADAERPVALAGVMGGEESEVTPGTVNLLLESARFDPLSIRSTSRRLRLMSDSSYRFERGLDPTLPVRASLRAAELILATAGGTLLGGCAEAGSAGHAPKTLQLRFATLRRLLGVDLPDDEVIEAFVRLGLNPSREGSDAVRVKVPSHRLDLSIEADLVEEAARVVGYDRIPLREQITVTVRPPDPAQQATNVVRDSLVAGGYHEAITFSFVSDALHRDFLPAGCSLRRVDVATRKADGNLRPSILPGLLEALQHNENVGNGPVKLFEIGSIFFRDEDGRPREDRRLAFVGGESYAETRGVLEAMLARLDADRPVRVEPAERSGFGKGACGRVLWGEQAIGFVGKIDAGICDRLGLRHVPAACMLTADALVSGYVPVPTMKPLPRFPAVRRDVSLVVGEDVSYAKLAAVVSGLGLSDLEAVEHAGTYRGKPLPSGQKSVTLALVFRSEAGTLTRDHADAAVKQVTDTAAERFGASVRN